MAWRCRADKEEKDGLYFCCGSGNLLGLDWCVYEGNQRARFYGDADAFCERRAGGRPAFPADSGKGQALVPAEKMDGPALFYWHGYLQFYVFQLVLYEGNQSDKPWCCGGTLVYCADVCDAVFSGTVP